eukprot:Rhum_TRINITY_DN12987_c0_g1::Rhum_TRINITY_DN12987_c0_g1_i1::g.55862::m.55862
MDGGCPAAAGAAAVDAACVAEQTEAAAAEAEASGASAGLCRGDVRVRYWGIWDGVLVGMLSTRRRFRGATELPCRDDAAVDAAGGGPPPSPPPPPPAVVFEDRREEIRELISLPAISRSLASGASLRHLCLPPAAALLQ